MSCIESTYSHSSTPFLYSVLAYIGKTAAHLSARTSVGVWPLMKSKIVNISLITLVLYIRTFNTYGSTIDTLGAQHTLNIIHILLYVIEAHRLPINVYIYVLGVRFTTARCRLYVHDIHEIIVTLHNIVKSRARSQSYRTQHIYTHSLGARLFTILCAYNVLQNDTSRTSLMVIDLVCYRWCVPCARTRTGFV